MKKSKEADCNIAKDTVLRDCLTEVGNERKEKISNPSELKENILTNEDNCASAELKVEAKLASLKGLLSKISKQISTFDTVCTKIDPEEARYMWQKVNVDSHGEDTRCNVDVVKSETDQMTRSGQASEEA